MCPQILSGIYPIAQVREPYTAVGYLAERVDLIRILRLDHPNADPRQAHCTRGGMVGKRKLGGGRDPVGELKVATLGLGGEGGRGEKVIHRGQEAATVEVREADSEEVWTAWDICDGRYNRRWR